MYIEEKIKGTLYMPDGTDFEFTESDVINNSVSISSQCMPDTSFVLGGVYSAQLDITLRISSENANAYNVLGSKIKIYTKYDKLYLK